MLKTAIKATWRHLPLKLPVLRALRAATRLPERVYRHLHFHGDFDVDVASGARFRIRSYANLVENDLFWAGYAKNYERASLAVWRDLCLEAETVLDVVANTGVYALTAAALNPRARVIAFEPVKRVCDRLRTNAGLNGNRIIVEHVAVSDQDGVAMLHDTEDEHVYSASLDYQMLGSTYSRSYEVPTISLDSYCAAHGVGRVDLVKIDVERHEPAVFRGFRRMLEESRPTVLVEILDAEIGKAVAEQISGLGYVVYELHEQGAKSGVFAAASLGQAERNYLLCQPDTAKQMGLPEPGLAC
jgi:FkbM family methyltransferase